MTTALSFIYNPSLFAVYYIRTDIDERERGRTTRKYKTKMWMVLGTKCLDKSLLLPIPLKCSLWRIWNEPFMSSFRS